MPNNIAVNISNLCKEYDNGNNKNKKVFENFNISFENGKVHCVLGTSGCGKSTLLRIIAGLEDYNSGEIIFNKHQIDINMIFQDNNLLPWMTVFKNVQFCYYSYLKSKKIKIDKKECHNKITDLLEKYNLDSYKDYYPYELSGGLKQKVALVKTLITLPNVILLDEAFSALDFKSKKDMHNLFMKEFAKNKFTSILSTHDIHEAVELGDYIHLIHNNNYIKIENPLRPPRVKNQEFDSFVELIMKKYNKGEK